MVLDVRDSYLHAIRRARALALRHAWFFVLCIGGLQLSLGWHVFFRDSWYTNLGAGRGGAGRLWLVSKVGACAFGVCAGFRVALRG